jgi:hypothetical protein
MLRATCQFWLMRWTVIRQIWPWIRAEFKSTGGESLMVVRQLQQLRLD